MAPRAPSWRLEDLTRDSGYLFLVGASNPYLEDPMPDLLVSVTAGAGGGILVVLGERFLFSAPSAWHGVKKSFRFYRQKYQEARGHYVISCPRCWRPDPDLVGNPALLPEGWEDAPRGVKWLRCSDCKHVWGIQEVVTWIGPAEDREDDGE